MYPTPSEQPIESSASFTAVRRFRGPVADEVFLLCRPDASVPDAVRQAESVYRGLLDTLAREGIAPEFVVAETVHLRPDQREFEVARAARGRVLAAAGAGGFLPASTFIGQAPLAGTHLELAAVALVPRGAASSSTRHGDERAMDSRANREPAARLKTIRLGNRTHGYAGNIFGSGVDRFAEALDMFRAAEAVLGEATMSFGEVIRTWIHVRDIDRDYDVLNQARREFLQSRGIERRPASTAVQGTPFCAENAFSLSLYAMSPRAHDAVPLSTPSLNEAWTYGADFSRGLRVADANKVALHVSGTASIDAAGRTAHAGNFAAQAERMLDNIASLLARQGAGFADVVSGVAYLKDPADAVALRSICGRRGFDGFPCALVEAPLCRPDLLCEAEAVAFLPFAPREA